MSRVNRQGKIKPGGIDGSEIVDIRGRRFTYEAFTQELKDFSIKEVDERLTDLENKLIKVLYYVEIDGGQISGTVSIPQGSEILLNQWPNGVDAVVSNIAGGKPNYKETGIDVDSLDSNGNYTLSGTLSTNPAAFIFYLQTPLIYLENLLLANIIEITEKPHLIDLSDVYVPSEPNDGELFYYSATDLKWKNLPKLRYIEATNYLQLGDIDGGNYTEFNEKGELRSYGEATQWDDLRVPITSLKGGGTKEPDWIKILDNGSGSQGVFTFYFDANTEEEVYFVCQLPHSWKQSSDLEAHVHWMPASNGSAGSDVCWGLEYTWANIGEGFSNTTIIYGDTNHLNETLVANKHYLTELGVINAIGKTFSSMLLCRIFRDATSSGGVDDYNDDAGLLEIDFHYQLDSLGSNEEYVKY